MGHAITSCVSIHDRSAHKARWVVASLCLSSTESILLACGWRVTSHSLSHAVQGVVMPLAPDGLTAGLSGRVVGARCESYLPLRSLEHSYTKKHASCRFSRPVDIQLASCVVCMYSIFCVLCSSRDRLLYWPVTALDSTTGST